MQKYVYVRSPLKAAQLLEIGFSYIKAPFGSKTPMFIFSLTDSLQSVLDSGFIMGEDYIIRDGAIVNF